MLRTTLLALCATMALVSAYPAAASAAEDNSVTYTKDIAPLAELNAGKYALQLIDGSFRHTVT